MADRSDSVVAVRVSLHDDLEWDILARFGIEVSSGDKVISHYDENTNSVVVEVTKSK